MFHLAYDFAHLACKWLYLCATYIDSEPLHFVSKSVEIFHASLCHWSLGNKLTLDLSRYIWKSLAGETSCCNFLPDCYLAWVWPEISKMVNLWGNSLKLGRIRQMRHCLWKNLVWRSGNALLVCFILLMILPIWPANGSLYVLPILIQNLWILHRNLLKFFTHHCATGLFGIN